MFVFVFETGQKLRGWGGGNYSVIYNIHSLLRHRNDVRACVFLFDFLFCSRPLLSTKTSGGGCVGVCVLLSVLRVRAPPSEVVFVCVFFSVCL